MRHIVFASETQKKEILALTSGIEIGIIGLAIEKLLPVRPWRNRQTRTFEGRMGDRMSSSLIGRTNIAGQFRCRHEKPRQCLGFSLF